MLTPMFVVIVALGTTDLLFALDSIPAIYGLTQEPYLVLTANIFALMGLRQLYFLIGGLLRRLVYLSYGLAFLLAFIGVKLVLHAMHENELPFVNGGEHISWAPDIPIWLSLAVIVGTLLVTTVASLAKTGRDARRERVTRPSSLPGRPERHRSLLLNVEPSDVRREGDSMQILMLVGSLRAGSWTGQVAEAIAELLPEGVNASVYDGLGSLPHYDQDLDGEHAPGVRRRLPRGRRLRRRPGGRHAGVQRLGHRRAQERHRLGLAPARLGTPSTASPPPSSPSARRPAAPSGPARTSSRSCASPAPRPLEPAVGVATVHDVLEDGVVADRDVRRALESLVASLVEAEAGKAA